MENTTESKKRKFPSKIFWGWFFGIFMLLAGNLVFFLTVWMANKYDHVYIDQFIYQLKAPTTGAERTLLGSGIIRVGLFGILLTVTEIYAYLLCSGLFKNKFRNTAKYLKICSSSFCRFISRKAVSIASWMLIFGIGYFAISLDIPEYLIYISSDSELIEREYVDPFSVDLEFPEQKRNLIFIFLESMETTYAEPEAGGPIKENVIVELAELAEEHINFSNDDNLGGALTYTGTTWTAAAMVTQTSGLIVQVPLTAGGYGGNNPYMPGATSIGQILEKEGYNQVLLVGSDARFAGRDTYFTEHGNYQILDTEELKNQGRLPEDYREFWGFEDEKLFAFAKEEVTRLAQEDAPFNFTMLTCDTHFPDGYKCRLCQDEYDEQYSNVMRCSARQVKEFVEWVQSQDFYENTTIVLTGDHLTMDPNYMQDVNEDYTRTTYNCFINSAVTPAAGREKNRQFGTFDIFPTTLAAMGVKIEGDRLGLGTNLFSDSQTLTEHYSFEILYEELQKNSEFYNKNILGMDDE